jgi:hypothetical protein
MDKIISQNLQAVADQGCHLEGSSPFNDIAYNGVYILYSTERVSQCSRPSHTHKSDSPPPPPHYFRPALESRCIDGL